MKIEEYEDRLTRFVISTLQLMDKLQITQPGFYTHTDAAGGFRLIVSIAPEGREIEYIGECFAQSTKCMISVNDVVEKIEMEKATGGRHGN